jgi:uncharacterized protein
MEIHPLVVRYADCVVTPWKNGRGVTREIAAAPSISGGADFGWRLSMAEVAADAPFSSFAGIERRLAVVEGGPLELTIDGAVHELVRGGGAVTFGGDAAVSGRSLDEPVTDLNLMLDRSDFVGQLEPVSRSRYDVSSGTAVIVSTAPTLALSLTWSGVSASTVELGRLDCVILVVTGPLTIEFEGERPGAYLVLVTDGSAG